MNAQLQQFARDTLKDGLAQCNDAQQMLFRRMYSHTNLELPIDEVINRLPENELDWAMQQVENTIIKNANEQSK